MRDGKVLCNRSYNATVFFVPGGKREGVETDVEVLVREMKEELSVDIRPETARHLHTFIAEAHGKGPGVYIQLACYMADFTGELAPANEIQEMQWLSYADTQQTSAVSQLVFEHLKNINLIS